MKKSIISASDLTIKDDCEVLLKNGNFSVYEGEFLGFCQNSQSRFFFPEILNSIHLKYSGILNYNQCPVSKKNLIPAFYISGTDMLIESMSIVDNFFVVRRQNGVRFLYSENKAKIILTEILTEMEIPFDINRSISSLSISEKYLLLLVKAIITGFPIIVLGNVTQNCNVDYYGRILKLIEKYKRKGRSFVLLSNDSHNLLPQCDRIYFCRGKYIADLLFQDEYSEQLFQDILFGRLNRGGRWKKVLADYTFVQFCMSGSGVWASEKQLVVYRGEVFGILDLYGTLTTQLFELFLENFPFWINGKKCTSYYQAVKEGLAIVSLHKGNVMYDSLSDEENLLFQKMSHLRRGIFINKRIEKYLVQQYSSGLTQFGIQNEWSISQLRHLIYRWLMTSPKVMVVDNPPLNLDLKQQTEFAELMQEVVSTGCSVILLSTEAKACMDLCNRVLVIYEEGKSELICLGDDSEE